MTSRHDEEYSQPQAIPCSKFLLLKAAGRSASQNPSVHHHVHTIPVTPRRCVAATMQNRRQAPRPSSGSTSNSSHATFYQTTRRHIQQKTQLFALILSSPSYLSVSSGQYPSRFSTKILCVFLILPMRATSPAHLILTYLILIIWGQGSNCEP